MHIINKICLILLSSCLTLLAHGQSAKEISVSGTQSYTDHLSLYKDSKDTDLMVKFVFDEGKEQLTVSLVSYRRLFVFRDDARYSQVVKGKKLISEKFPYVVNADAGQKFFLGKPVKNSIPKPRKRYIFKRWLSYDGLIPVEGEYQMVNDYIEQKLDIKNKADIVKVRLRDIYLMDTDGRKATRFTLSYGKDMDTEYRVAIQRDPCFGKQDEIATATQALNNLQTGFKPFYSKYKSGKVASDENLAVFKKTKEILLQQFPKHEGDTLCSTLRDIWTQYNHCVDTLIKMRCTVDAPVVMVEGVAQGGIQPVYLHTCTRQLDTIVSQWLLTNDATLREDLKSKGEGIISEANEAVKKQGVITPEQKNALNLFQAGVKYFQQKCR